MNGPNFTGIWWIDWLIVVAATVTAIYTIYTYAILPTYRNFLHPAWSLVVTALRAATEIRDLLTADLLTRMSEYDERLAALSNKVDGLFQIHEERNEQMAQMQEQLSTIQTALNVPKKPSHPS